MKIVKMQWIRLSEILLVGVVLLMAIIHIGSGETKRQYSWKLTGKEILLQLEHRGGKEPPGIYAVNPFDDDDQLRLLISGGERPVWSSKRNFIAYIKGDWLYIVRRDGSEEVEVAWCVADGDYHFHDPPVVWDWEEGFDIVERNTAFGSVVSRGLGPLKELKSLKEIKWIGVLSGGVMPLPRRLGMDELPRWSELLTTNNPTFSPDGNFMAAEVYPAPMDLRRGQSRIFIFGSAQQEEYELWWFAPPQAFPRPGRRLTSLSDNSCELMPLWSPTGEWIAFTLVSLEKGFVAPVVIHPDGSGMIMLLPTEPCEYWPGKKWLPIGVEKLEKAWDERAGWAPLSWGYPDICAVEWSPDGKYLLLNSGRRFDALMVAKWEDGKWWGRGTWGQSWVRFATWGPEGPWFAFVPGRRPSLERAEMIIVKNVETLAEIDIHLDPDLVVRWMNW